MNPIIHLSITDVMVQASDAAPTCFQDIVACLQTYWAAQGCAILQPFDMEVGAGTLHPATLLRALGPKPWRAVYVQPTRRPADGRYGDNPNRLQHYYQLQVLLKPDPPDIQDLYLASLSAIGIDRQRHDIRFVEDDWENPTVGASGLGWEVWCDGMEVSQFTYFQEVGGIKVNPTSGELTYGLERLAMYVLKKDNVFDLPFNSPGSETPLSYGDVFRENERQQSAYNFVHADTKVISRQLDECETANRELLALESPLAIPAYEQALRASHLFNLLDARKAVSANARPGYIRRIRAMATGAAAAWLARLDRVE